MKELLFLAAAAISEEKIVEELKDACFSWEENPSDENRGDILKFCQLMLTKSLVGDDLEKALERMTDYQQYQQREKLFQTDNN